MKNKHIKSFNQYNESLWGDIQRGLNPYRKEADEKATSLFQDILEDYDKYPDLKKVKINDEGGNSISLDKVRIGKYYTLSYVFGRYHPVLRDIHTGNREAGDRRIKITSIPFSITIRKNELEKMFKTDRINIGEVRVEDIKTNHNYERNPNVGKHALYKEKIDEYNISSDIANQIFNYFINEFKSKYPDLDNSKYKGSMSIRDIEKGVSPVIKYIYVKGKDGEDITVGIRKGDNIEEIKKMVSNMTKTEHDKYHRQKQEELYKHSSDKMKARQEEVEKKIDQMFKKNGIELETSKWDKYGFSLRGNIDYDFNIQFKYNKDISTEIKSAIKDGLDDYKIELINVSDGWSDKSQKFYTIEFKK
jgi:DNA-binding transcriptional MerR regulator